MTRRNLLYIQPNNRIMLKVYRISLTDSSGTGWHVYRRFSDFFPFDVQAKKILPKLQTTLPSREIIRPLAGLLGVKAKEPSPEFLDIRRKGLDLYVRDLLKTAGGSRTALWNHPAVLTFFDIPTVIQRDSPASDLSCPVPLSEWDAEFMKAKSRLKDALETKERAESAGVRGHDSSNYYKHMKRQINAAKKAQRKLETSLDFFARIDKVDDGMLEEMAGRFQNLAGQIEALSGAVGESGGHLIPSSSTNPSLVTVSPKSGPIAKTPIRSSSLNGGMKKNPTPPMAPAPMEAQNTRDSQLSEQARIVQKQDQQLSELSSIIAKHRSLGEAIGRELGNEKG